MKRGGVNGIGQGLDGDLTTTGAVCISSLPNAAQGGQGVLRLGDKTTPCKKCGKVGVIVDSLPAMKWDGVPTALDGAQIHCGCPPGSNRLIAPIERSRAPGPAVRSAAPPVGNPATSAQPADSVPTQRATASFVNTGAATSPANCNHLDQMEELATYIAGEMNRNIQHPAVLEMKELNSFDPHAETKRYFALPFYLRLGRKPDFYSFALGKKAKAFAIWTERVGQNRPWDHKPKLENLHKGVVWHKQGKYDYYYDIWSNIHYGYVGIAGGLSESMLLDGAGVEQIGSDTYRYLKNPERFKGPQRTEGVDGLRAWDDAPDRISIIIGIKLYELYPNGGLTAKRVMDEVLALNTKEWGTGIRDHKCTQ